MLRDFFIGALVEAGFLCYTFLHMNLATSVSELNGVGKKTAANLARMGIVTVRDLLYYPPLRYEDYRSLKSISDVQVGETVTVRVKVALIANKRSFRRRLTVTEALVEDESGSMRVVWFNQPFLIKNLTVGDEVFLSGKITSDLLGKQMASPLYERVGKEGSNVTSHLVPVYSLSAGITQKQLRYLVGRALPLTTELSDWLPEDLRQAVEVVPLPVALRDIHVPKDDVAQSQAVRRYKFEELFPLQLKAELNRQRLSEVVAPILHFRETEIKNFVVRLPFTLTKAQKIAAWEILQDTGRTVPMNRLLSGDVGSGKTVVAAMNTLNTALNGYQTVVLVPTEILAEQHFVSFKKLLASEQISVALFTRTQRMLWQNGVVTVLSKKQMVTALSGGEITVVIGTHAVISEAVEFKKLGLVIVDEQHRFGVAQRQTLKKRGEGVHFLSMTATPIPRSLALTFYGDLDLSTIDELPPGRKKVLTRLVTAAEREKAYQFIRTQVKAGRQVFVVCPLIGEGVEENEEQPLAPWNQPVTAAEEKKSVLQEYQKLTKDIFPDLRVGYVHGKMVALEKEKAMTDFREQKLDILVATSVVEVGVDIPNATVMMIEGADRFGLAQLHQFRGRVGRSVHQSYCFLFTNSPSTKVKERLEFFETHGSGFALAEKDLEWRGPGEVYGTLQSGDMQFRLATLMDTKIIQQARELARVVAPRLQDFPTIKKMISRRDEEIHWE